MTYDEALAWLFTRTRGGGSRTPHRAARLLERLELTPPPLVVSVVGTNGKGSVTHMTATGLSAAGHRTGRFLSPHVEAFPERIAVDGVAVSEGAVIAFVTAARARLPDDAGDPELGPAFFEWTLALALQQFAELGADAAVLEAGVGGASDATRAIEPVSLVVLTNVDLDHLGILGNDLTEIARDKAGAIRPGAPVVSGAQQPEVRELIAAEAERLGAPLFQDDLERPPAAIFSLPSALEAAMRRAPGTRVANARLAAAALRLLGATEAAVEAGLRAPPLPARHERFRLPLPPAPGAPPAGAPTPGAAGERAGATVEVVLDGAHDPIAAQSLRRDLGGRPYVLLFGSLARKQGERVLEELARGATDVLVTEASPGEEAWHPPDGATFVAEPEAALDRALELAAARASGSGDARREGGGPLLLVAGSLYLAGRIRPLLRGRGSRLPAPWEPEAPHEPGARDEGGAP